MDSNKDEDKKYNNKFLRIVASSSKKYIQKKKKMANSSNNTTSRKMKTNKAEENKYNIEFLQAVASGSGVTSKVAKLFSKIDINYQESQSENTALHLAVLRGDEEIIEFLVELGVDVFLKNKQGKTAKQLAITRGLSKFVINLLGNQTERLENEPDKTEENSIDLDISKPIKWKEICGEVNQSCIAIIKLINCNRSQLVLEIIKNNDFRCLINKSPFVFIIDIVVDDTIKSQDANFHEFLTKIDPERPFIVQIRCNKNARQVVYHRNPTESVTTWKSDECQIVTDITYLTDAKRFNLGLLLNMLKSGYGGKFQDDLLKCTFDGTMTFDNWHFIDYAAYYNDVVSLRLLLLLGHRDLAVKNGDDRRSFEIAAEFGDDQTMATLLNLPFDKKSLKYGISEKYNNLLALEDSTGRNPVRIAIEKGKPETVELLIELSCLNKAELQSSVDLLWDNHNYSKLLVLLKQDSPFPTNFVLNCSHDAIRSIAMGREKLHTAIKDNDENTVSNFVKNNPNIKYAYNKENRIALSTALESEQYKMFALLQHYGFLKDDSVRNLLGNLSKPKQTIVQNEKDILLKEIEYSHLFYLISSSKHAKTIDEENFRKRITQLFEQLNKIERISQVLKVVKFAEKLEVIFDFEEESIVDIDVSGSEQTRGSCHYKSARIFIGGNRLKDSEILGTLAHELTHLAMQIVYNNDCNPYHSLDTDKKNSFDTIVKSFENDKKCDDVIKTVFTSYRNPEQWPSELIVRVNHMLALYPNNSKKKLEDAANLVEWYDKNVFTDCDNFLKQNYISFKCHNEIQHMNEQNGLIDEVSVLTEKIEIDSALLPSSHKFDSDSIKIIITDYSKSDLLISYQLLRTMTRSIISRNVIFMSSIELLNCLTAEKIHRLNKSIVRPKIIIDCTQISHLNFISTINDLIFKNNIILLVLKEQAPQLKCDIKLKNIKIIQGHQHDFYSLSEKSKENILNSAIVFQNVSMKLRFILPRDSPVGKYLLLKHILKDEMLSQDESPIIQPRYFMERNFRSRIKLDERYRNLETEDKLTFSEEKFQSECKVHPQENIHLFSTSMKGSKQWVKSRGSISNLRQYMNENVYISGNDLSRLAEITQIVLLSDFPGMGKSTVISEIAKLAKQEKKNRWVSVIRLIEHTDTFYKFGVGNILSAEQGVSFLVENVLKLKSTFEKELFRYSCLGDKSLVKVVLFFDGLDEVSPTHYDLVVGLITQLRKTSIEQIWVTTRPHQVRMLEDAFNTVHHEMTQFSYREQVQFLFRSWLNMEISTINWKIELFAKSLIDKIISSHTIVLWSPLFLFILAKTYSECVRCFCESADDDPRQYLAKTEIGNHFRLFIDEKFGIYEDEKSKIPLSTQAAKDRADRDRRALLEAHQIFALHHIFEEDETFQKKFEKKEKLFTNDELSRIGLVTVNDGKIDFIHHSFAEYFIAQYTIAQFVDDFNDFRMLEIVLKYILREPKFSVIQTFLNEIINKPFTSLFLKILEKHGYTRELVELLVIAGSFNTLKYLLLGFESIDRRGIIVRLTSNTFLIEIDHRFCFGLLLACRHRQIDLVQLLMKIYSRSTGKSLNQILGIVWFNALKINDITFLDDLFSWIVEEYPTIGITLLLKETTWIAAVDSDGNIVEKLRNWSDEHKLSSIELKVVLMRKSMWEIAAKMGNLTMLSTLWKWCKEVHLEEEECRRLLGNLELWRLALGCDNNDLLYLLLKWLSELDTWGDSLNTDEDKYMDDAKRLETACLLITTFDCNEDYLKVLFRVIMKLYEWRLHEKEFLERLRLNAENLLLNHELLNDEILFNWRCCCYHGNSFSLESLWQWMKISSFTNHDKRRFVFDSFSWELALLKNNSTILRKLWQWSYEQGLNKD